MRGVQALRFPMCLNDQQAAMLVAKFGQGSQFVNFGQFMGICAYLMLCVKLMVQFTGSAGGVLRLNAPGLINLGIWFL